MQKFKAVFFMPPSKTEWKILSRLWLTEIIHAHALFSLKSTFYSARSLVLNMRLNLNWTMKERTKESQINCPCWLFFEGHHRAASLFYFFTIPALSSHTHSFWHTNSLSVALFSESSVICHSQINTACLSHREKWWKLLGRELKLGYENGFCLDC